MELVFSDVKLTIWISSVNRIAAGNSCHMLYPIGLVLSGAWIWAWHGNLTRSSASALFWLIWGLFGGKDSGWGIPGIKELTSTTFTLSPCSRASTRLRPSKKCWDWQQRLWAWCTGGGIYHRTLASSNIQSKQELGPVTLHHAWGKCEIYLVDVHCPR